MEHRRAQQMTANKQAWDAQSQAHLAKAAAASAAGKASQEKVGSPGGLTRSFNRVGFAVPPDDQVLKYLVYFSSAGP